MSRSVRRDRLSRATKSFTVNRHDIVIETTLSRDLYHIRIPHLPSNATTGWLTNAKLLLLVHERRSLRECINKLIPSAISLRPTIPLFRCLLVQPRYKQVPARNSGKPHPAPSRRPNLRVSHKYAMWSSRNWFKRCACVRWHSRLKTSDRADLGSNRPSLCELRSWVYGRSYFTVTLRERTLSYARPRVYDLTKWRVSCVLCGLQGVLETCESSTGETLCRFASRALSYVHRFRIKRHFSCNPKIKMSHVMIFFFITFVIFKFVYLQWCITLYIYLIK